MNAEKTPMTSADSEALAAMPDTGWLRLTTVGAQK